MKLIIVFNQEKITDMMQRCDVFEDFKCIVVVVEAEVKKPLTLKQMRKILKGDDEMKPVLVYMEGKKPVYDEKYKVYSNGTKWVLRDDFIKLINP